MKQEGRKSLFLLPGEGRSYSMGSVSALNRYKQYSFQIDTDEWRIFSLPEETELELALKHRRTDAFSAFWSSPVPATIDFSKKVLEELTDSGNEGRKIKEFENGAVYMYETEYYGEPYVYLNKVYSCLKGSWGVSVYMSRALYLGDEQVVNDLLNAIDSAER